MKQSLNLSGSCQEAEGTLRLKLRKFTLRDQLQKNEECFGKLGDIVQHPKASSSAILLPNLGLKDL